MPIRALCQTPVNCDLKVEHNKYATPPFKYLQCTFSIWNTQPLLSSRYPLNYAATAVSAYCVCRFDLRKRESRIHTVYQMKAKYWYISGDILKDRSFFLPFFKDSVRGEKWGVAQGRFQWIPFWLRYKALSNSAKQHSASTLNLHPCFLCDLFFLCLSGHLKNGGKVRGAKVNDVTTSVRNAVHPRGKPILFN